MYLLTCWREILLKLRCALKAFSLYLTKKNKIEKVTARLVKRI